MAGAADSNISNRPITFESKSSDSNSNLRRSLNTNITDQTRILCFKLMMTKVCLKNTDNNANIENKRNKLTTYTDSAYNEVRESTEQLLDDCGLTSSSDAAAAEAVHWTLDNYHIIS